MAANLRVGSRVRPAPAQRCCQVSPNSAAPSLRRDAVRRTVVSCLIIRHDRPHSRIRSRSDLPVDLPHDFRPAVDDWQHGVRLLSRESRNYAGYPHFGEALDAVGILAERERGDFDGGRIAAGFSGHVAEFRQDLGNIATRGWYPAVAIADRAARAIREGAADMDRRMWLLYRFGPGDHRVEIHEF